MAVGQAVLSPESGLSAAAAVGARLEASERARSAAHGVQLQEVLELLRLFRREGLEVSAPAELALRLRCSEHRAVELLTSAEFFAALPGGFAALDDGWLTVEQIRPVVQALNAVAIGLRVQVWRQLLAQLELDAQSGVVRPPQRLKELLARLLLAADPDSALEPKKASADRDADVTYDRRDDGLVDLHAFGISSPEAQAAFRNLAERAQAAGSWDDRTAGQRRLDALMDLLLGRQPLGAADSSAACSGGGCGCPPGGAGPCGAQLVVHVPLATALGMSDVPAELVGHGPLDPDELSRLLLAAPDLHAVFVDEHGTPVACSDHALRPERGDPLAVREALLALTELPPGECFPRHPDDHPPPEATAPAAAEPEPPPAEPAPTAATRPQQRQHRHLPVDPLAVLAAATLGLPDGTALPDSTGSTGTTVTTGRSHPAGLPGAYSIRPRLRLFLRLRAPRCEWPGCGARAARCDLDHDTAWPQGATCACNLGPLCRRHHRTKQNGWTKTRHGDGSTRWTSPTGRSWTSPGQNPAPPAPTRPLPPVLLDAGRLSPTTLAEERLLADPTHPRWTGVDTDPAWLHTDPDHDPQADTDHLRRRIRNGETAWDLDLHDPYAWTDLRPLDHAGA